MTSPNLGRHDKGDDDGASHENDTEGHSRTDDRSLISRLLVRQRAERRPGDSMLGKLSLQRTHVPAWDEHWDLLSDEQKLERLYTRKLRTERVGHRDRIQQLLIFLLVVGVVFFGLRGYGNQARFAEDLSKDVARDRVTGEVRACESRNDFRREVRAVFDILTTNDSVGGVSILESPEYLALDQAERDFVNELVRLAAESGAAQRQALEDRYDEYKEQFPITGCAGVRDDLEARYGIDGTG